MELLRDILERRGVALAIAALCVGILVVGLGTARLVSQSRAMLVDQLEGEQQRTVEEVARTLRDDIDQIAADLRFIDHLMEAGEPARRTSEIAALLAWTKQYQRVGVYDVHGKPIVEVRDPTAPPGRDPPLFVEQMRAVAAATVHGVPGELASTRAVPFAGGWSRVFAMPLRALDGQPRGVVAMLVDTEPLFAKLKLATARSDSHLVLLGARGGTAPVTDAALAADIQALDGAKTPVFAQIVAGMKAGERALRRIDADEAERLGLGQAAVVVAYAPVTMNARLHWSVAVLTSIDRLADHERALLRRLTLSATAVVALLGLFGAYVVVSSRRKAALEARLRASAEIERAHARTEKILNQIPTGVMILGADRRVLALNRALAERLRPEAVGAPLGDALPEAPLAVTTLLDALVADAEAKGHVVSLHGQRLGLFGEEGQYNLHAVPLERGATAEHALLVIEDVTAVHALESQLLRAEKLATVGELAAGVAHEIGTPLGVVRGRAEYVLGKLGAAHAQSSGLRDMIEQIDQVTRTIRQLLDFSRVSPARVQPVALPPIVRDVLELLRFESERRRVATRLDEDAELPLIAADPDQLRQVLVNLVLNALDACAQAGQVSGEVVVRARVEAPLVAPWHRVRIEVDDNGCGIPARELPRVFDPFFTTKKRGQGTGLGLAVTAQVIRNHGGEIQIESEERRGTRVLIWWPAAAARPTERRHVN